MAEGALFNLHVVDISQGIAGPYCASLMAGLGAEVIKVEPLEGDIARRSGPFFQDDPNPEKSGLFLYINQGKKGITLNLGSTTAHNLFLKLVAWADIVIESFKPGYLESLGLGYAELEKVNPRLLLTSITPFGQSGPYRDWKGSELISYAMGGQMYQFGDPDKEPLKTGGSVAQYFAGMMGMTATLTALFNRRVTGEGQHVDISMTEAIASMLEGSTAGWKYAGVISGRSANSGRTAAEGQYQCKDGYVQVSTVVGNNASFQRFKDLMGVPELGDPRFAAAEGRIEHRAEIDRLMQPWLSSHTKLEIYELAQANRLPFGYASTSEDLINSPQFKARGYFVELDHPVTGTLTYPGAPYKMTETPWQSARAPLLGEHNAEVYCTQLGLPTEDLARLRAEGVV